MCIYECLSMVISCECCACGGQDRASDPLGLDLQLVVCWLMWVLRTKPGSAVRAATACNC